MSNFIDETYKRVEGLIRYKGLNISSFEDKIKVSNNSIGTAIRRKASFKSNVLNKILNTFPDIHPTWLLTGRGSMFLKKQTNNVLQEPYVEYETEDLSTQIKASLIDLLTNDSEIKELLATQVQKTNNEEE